MTAKEAFKWDGSRDKWVPYFKITYLYGGNEITMEYAAGMNVIKLTLIR